MYFFAFAIFKIINVLLLQKNFHLKVKNPEEPVAPGLCVPASVEYNATEETEMTDRLVLTIDDEILEVPIFT